MSVRDAISAGMLALLGATAASADCNLSSDPSAAIRPVSIKDTNLILSMSMMPKMIHLDYATATAKGGCHVGQFAVGSVSYDLFGSDDKGRSRRAVPSKAGEPAAIMVPIVDVMKAIEASKQGKSAPSEGYMLATVDKDKLVGWQLYSGMPNQTTLLHDMAAILNGEGKPIFENQGDKTSLFVPK